VTEVGPFVVAVFLVAYLRNTEGLSPRAAGRDPDRRRKVLWFAALVFFALASKSAWSWAQELWFEMNNAVPSWGWQAEAAVTEVGPLVLAIYLMAFLWRTDGPPFSSPRGKSPASTKGESAAEEPRPQWKSFESRAESERRSQNARDAAGPWRVALWSIMFPLLLASSGWALLCVTCAVDGPGYLFNGYRKEELLAMGLAPLGLVVLLAFALWGAVGLPFVNHRRK
jgi:hypothetical protein